jgi:hypothetical protein
VQTSSIRQAYREGQLPADTSAKLYENKSRADTMNNFPSREQLNNPISIEPPPMELISRKEATATELEGLFYFILTLCLY